MLQNEKKAFIILINIIYFIFRSVHQGPKSVVADPPSRMTIENSDLQIQNGRQRLKPMMIQTIQTQKTTSNNDVPTFPPQGSRVALLSVKFDIDDKGVDVNDTTLTEIKVTSKENTESLTQTKETTPVDEKPDSDKNSDISKSREISDISKEKENSDISKSKENSDISKSRENSERKESDDSSVRISTVLGEVRFCNGKGIHGGNSVESCDKTSDDLMNDLDDVIDHVTTISVDVHMIDSLRGPVKVTNLISLNLKKLGFILFIFYICPCFSLTRLKI